MNQPANPSSPRIPRLGTWLKWVILIGGAGIMLWPLVVIVGTSLQPPGTVMGAGGAASWSLENYREAWLRGNFLRAFANSALVALSVTGFQLFTSALAGYALARMRFWGQKVLLLTILATLIIPFQLLVIPIFMVLKGVVA